MKRIISIVTAVCASIALFTACSKDNSITELDGLHVSSSYVSIAEKGATATITLHAAGDWKLEKVTTKKNKVEWLTVSPTTGHAGETQISFTAPASLDGRTAEVIVTSNGETQHINVIQGLPTVSKATCAAVLAGVDNKSYRVTGTCVSINNTTYGNFYLNDGTGQLYVYGTKDAGGNYAWKSFNIEVGDEVTVEGPRSTYNGVGQLKDATFISVKKSLIKVDAVENDTLPVAGGTFTAHLVCKGQGVSVDIPNDAKSWLAISGIQSTATKTTVQFTALPNTGGDRSTTLTFRTTEGGKTYTAQTQLVQTGAIVAATIDAFNKAAVGSTQYRIAGIVTDVKDATKGNFTLKDHSGSIFVYKAKDFQTKGVKVGDIVTLVGERGQYNATPQMVKATIEEHKKVEQVSIADFRAKPDSKDTYYMIKGTVGKSTEANTKFDLTQYGNFALTDATGNVYVYGVATGWGGKKGEFGTLHVSEGDQLTLIAAKTTYKGLVEAISIFYSK